MEKSEYLNRVPISKNNICIYRDEKNCTNCGACKGICKTKIGVYGVYDMAKAREPICINCGQCSLICPNNSIHEVRDYKKVKNEILKGRCVIVQIAPATRFLIGDEFEYSIGKNVIGKVITSLKKLGVSYVFDTAYGADLTICEEACEFIERLRNNDRLPLMTSCCPGWVKYVSEFYPEYKKNLSTCKSPILMTGSIIKNFYARENNIDNPLVVAIVPCTAKKYEITKSNDVDYAITVRELSEWIKEENINFHKLKNMRFDDFTGTSSGIIFGASGGVTEAMIRYTYHRLTGNSPTKKLLNFEPVRGLVDIKEANLRIKDREISIAVVNGTGDVPKLIDMIEKENKHYDIIEVMACDGGCIAGGGGPKGNKVTNSNKNKRLASIYRKDRNIKRRNSYENPKIKKLYKQYLIKPNSKIAHELLHVKEVNDE